jgi:hypothetical protein
VAGNLASFPQSGWIVQLEVFLECDNIHPLDYDMGLKQRMD